MFICQKCGCTYAEHTNFCSRCGGAVVSSSPASSPVVPAVSGGIRGKGIAGMAVSIEAIVGAFISFLYSLIAMGMAGHLPMNPFAFVAIFASIIHIVAGIVGRVLSSNAYAQGYVSGITSIGRILGLIATILSAVALFLSFVAATI